jgi:iron complex outermembrane recepter protein
MSRPISIFVLIYAFASGGAALAQRADDNVLTAADDAFGSSVGSESIGLYNAADVRGFSPVDAGNVRLEGLYFDQQSAFSDRLIDGANIRVGLSAQSYAFASPTGVADFRLRSIGDEPVVSVAATLGPFGTLQGEVDTQIPIIETLSLAAGVSYTKEKTYFGGSPVSASGAIILRFKPADNLTVTPFWSHSYYGDEEAEPLIFTDGPFLPPRIRRRDFYGQKWTKNSGTGSNFGVVANADVQDYTLQAGIFRSLLSTDKSFADLFVDVDRDGTAAEHVIVADAGNKYASYSGELRFSRLIDNGHRRHKFHLMLRGRHQKRSYGGEDIARLGSAGIGIAMALPQPQFAFSDGVREVTTQVTGGAAYELQWKRVGEFSVGVQKTRYRKSFFNPRGSANLQPSFDRPWLYNGSAAIYISQSLVAYGSMSRGLEEGPVAPDIALNRDEAAPAILTRQLEAGIRWNLGSSLKLIAGVFEISKPYFNVDEAGTFRQLGQVRHKGVELSLTGHFPSGLKLLAGTTFLDAEVRGSSALSGPLSFRPVGAINRTSVLSFDYRPRNLSAWSIDMIIQSTGNRVANSDGDISISPRAIISVGGRYRFSISGVPATFRVQIGNIMNKFGWAVASSGYFFYNAPRRLTVSLSTDF